MTSTDVTASATNLPDDYGCLPNEAYTDPAYFEQERRTVLSSTWQFAGRASAVPDPGDMLPTSVAATPVFLVRQRSGEIAAFYNVCPHRGAKVLPKPCKSAKTIICPYHTWSYNLDGTLRRRPHFDGADNHDVARDDDGVERPSLWRVRAEVFMDWVFLNLDGNAEPLSTQLQPLVDKLEGYDFANCVYGGELTFDVRTNWKLAHENFLDILHKIGIHPELQKSSPIQTNVRYEWLSDDLAISHHTVEEPFEGRGEGLPGLPGFPESMRRLGLSAHIYPNANLQLWDGQLTLFSCTPLAPDHTIETFSVYFAEEAMGEQHRAHRDAVFDMWRHLNEQDIEPLIWMQEARNIPVFNGGSFSPYWDEMIAKYVEKLKTDTRGFISSMTHAARSEPS